MIFSGRRLSGEELAAVQADPDTVIAVLDTEPTGPEPAGSVDLDKAWHGLHYLLTGSAHEIPEGPGEAILGGDPIGPDLGMGPARLLEPKLVARVAAALDSMDETTLRARYDPAALGEAEVYPHVWEDGDVEFDDYLLPHYHELRTFYRNAAARGEAVLLTVN
ncbi:YfbM family protein [Micromonospora sp. DT31]|uniref:YfbM family protein n=1 Tax=Micromonospora sp. DT31 TaxID=3393434 RepID=UPI003CEF5E44